MFLIQVTQGPDKGRKLEVEPGQSYTIGCEDEAQLKLSDPMVLKGHCSLEVGRDSAILRNHTATAGTFVGSKKISQARIPPNTPFRIGETTLVFAAAPRAAKRGTTDALVGKILGGYKLKEIVGEGGMGKVYKADQLSLHRDVALKVLRDQLAKDKAFRDLFVNEARAAAQLIHPNVVQVYDAGREGEVTFFSMEFIGQGSVEEILAQNGKIAWEEAILMVLEAAHGLEYAEQKGIVHRDIKPDNLMINDDGRVKIADLGLAKRGEGGEQKGIIGTPHFIPPEQALGKEVDTRADIYSLGATFFRMITGKTLFTGKTAKEIVLKHIKEPPPAASSVESTIPDDLDLVIAKMLAKDPEKRYQSAGELVKALEEVCAHHGIKGAIIRKGVSKKILVPLAVLLIGAAVAIYMLVVRGPKIVEDEESKRAAVAAQKRQEEERRQRLAAEKQTRRGDADLAWKNLEVAELRTKDKNKINNVYDSENTEENASLEAEWLKLADQYEKFSKNQLAEEFDSESQYVSKAKEAAKRIRTQLDKFKRSAADKKQTIEAKVTKIKEIDQKLQAKLSDLRVKQQYEKAVNLCQVAATGEPATADPFQEIQTGEWTSPVDSSVSQKLIEIDKISKPLAEARKNYRREGPRILTDAKTAADAVFKKYDDLKDGGSEKEMNDLIAELGKIIEFRDSSPDANQVPEIREKVNQATTYRNSLQKQLRQLIEARRHADRVRVAKEQRHQCSLDPETSPNNVMECGYSSAIRAWNNLLVNGEIKTERYQAFVKERIEMLRWCEYLFAHFQVDLRRAIKGKGDDHVFRSIELDTIPFPDKEMTGRRLALEDEAGRYQFALRKSYKGDKVFAFSRFPMNWVHHTVFLYQNEPRWVEVPPALRFALAAFCFETMQYKEAQRHLKKLLEVEDADVRNRYGAVAKSLLERADKERLARFEWEEICQAILAAESVQAVEAIRARALAYRQKHAGTIFQLDTLGYRDEPRVDFYSTDSPPIPKAPPPPTADD